MKRAFLSVLAGVALALALAAPVVAAPITFIHQGSGAGSLDGVDFADSAFVIEAQGDTSTRSSFATGYWIDHITASITIQGLGTYTFLTPTRTFVNNSNRTVGFSRAGGGGSDLFNGPQDDAFAAWDMLSSIGPIGGFANLIQWNLNPQIVTNGGVLFFQPSRDDATFEAITGDAAVPEPTTLLLLGAGTVGLRLLRRRRGD